MKVKSRLTIVLIILGIAIGTNSCENESVDNEVKSELEYTYDFAEVNFKNLDVNNEFSDLKENAEFIMSTKFKTNLKIPKTILESKNEKLFRQFLMENEEKLDGELIFIVNGKIENSFELGNTPEIRYSSKSNDDYPRRTECSYEGVRQCTQYSIYEKMNKFDKLVCAYAGLGCIAERAASCYSSNCLGDTSNAKN